MELGSVMATFGLLNLRTIEPSDYRPGIVFVLGYTGQPLSRANMGTYEKFLHFGSWSGWGLQSLKAKNAHDLILRVHRSVKVQLY